MMPSIGAFCTAFLAVADRGDLGDFNYTHVGQRRDRNAPSQLTKQVIAPAPRRGVHRGVGGANAAY